jgi:hypothetical protein
MRGFDVFVLPSLAEGISNTILEAMATGLPIVATRVGGNPELVEEGRTALLVPSNDPHAMAAAIEVYVDDAAKRAQHGAAGRATAEARFSLQAMVGAYLGIYDRALAPRLWMYWYDAAAQRYAREFGGDVRTMFPRSLREHLAEERAKSEYERIMRGEYGEVTKKRRRFRR